MVIMFMYFSLFVTNNIKLFGEGYYKDTSCALNMVSTLLLYLSFYQYFIFQVHPCMALLYNIERH